MIDTKYSASYYMEVCSGRRDGLGFRARSFGVAEIGPDIAQNCDIWLDGFALGCGQHSTLLLSPYQVHISQISCSYLCGKQQRCWALVSRGTKPA